MLGYCLYNARYLHGASLSYLHIVYFNNCFASHRTIFVQLVFLILCTHCLLYEMAMYSMEK